MKINSNIFLLPVNDISWKSWFMGFDGPMKMDAALGSSGFVNDHIYMLWSNVKDISHSTYSKSHNLIQGNILVSYAFQNFWLTLILLSHVGFLSDAVFVITWVCLSENLRLPLKEGSFFVQLFAMMM